MPLALLASVALAATAVLPMLRTDRWWIRVLDFPRLQLLASYLAAAGLVAAWGRGTPGAWAAAGVLGAASAYQLAWVLPYLRASPVEAQDASRRDPKRAVRLLIANVRKDNRDADRLIRLVEETRPDLVVIDEPDRWWIERLAVLERAFPHVTAYPLDNAYGMAVYSRLPVDEAEVRFLVEPDVPSIQAKVRMPSGEAFRLVSVHPRPPVPGSDAGGRDAELVLVGREAARRDEPTIVAGDMNDVGWSPTSRLFQAVGGLLDPRRGRGLYATFPADMPPVLRYPLDHVFHSAHFRLAEMRTLPSIGSDHLPLLIELSYEPEGIPQQRVPRADADEQAAATEELARGRVSG